MLHRVSTCFSFFFSVVKWVAKTARKPHITTLSVLSSLSPFFIFLVYFVSFTSFHHVFRESVYVFSGLVQYINWGEGVHTRKNVWGPCHLNNVLYTHTHTSWITRYRPHTHTRIQIYTPAYYVYISRIERSISDQCVWLEREKHGRLTQCCAYSTNTIRGGKAIEGKVMIRVQYPLYPVALFFVVLKLFFGVLLQRLAAFPLMHVLC